MIERWKRGQVKEEVVEIKMKMRGSETREADRTPHWLREVIGTRWRFLYG